MGEESCMSHFSQTLCNFLPSRSFHHRRKLSMHALPDAIKQSTLPQDMLTTQPSSITEEIHRLLSISKRTSITDKMFSMDIPLKDDDDSDIECAIVAYEEACIPDEEKDKDISVQLTALRDLPLPMGEKRNLRKQLRESITVMEVQKTLLGMSKIKILQAWENFKEKYKEFANKSLMWSSNLKYIEGRFGTSIVSYFVFLRWLFFLNVVTSIFFVVFIILPQVLLWDFKHSFPALNDSEAHEVDKIIFSKNEFSTKRKEVLKTPHLSLANDRRNISDECYELYVKYVEFHTQRSFASGLQDLFQGTGWMENTLMFIGFYSPSEVLAEHRNVMFHVSTTYLGVLIVSFLVCILMMVAQAAKGVQETLVSEEQKKCNFSKTVFSGWDFCITNRETAHLKNVSLANELKSQLTELWRINIVSKWTNMQKVIVYSVRITVNMFVLTALVAAYYLLYYVCKFHIKEERDVNIRHGFTVLLIQFLPPITITTLNVIYAAVCQVLVQFENYGYQQAINITLARVVFIRLASILILVTSFYSQFNCEPRSSCGAGIKTCSRPLCWETYVGQQMYKLVLTDVVVVLGITFCLETPRQYVAKKWPSKLTGMIGQQMFDIPNQVLALIYSQTLCWLGIFFSPFLSSLCAFKVVMTFYTKKFTLIKNCTPPRIPFRASRSNAVFIGVLMISFFATVIVVGYSVTKMETSPACGPFRFYTYMISVLSDEILNLNSSFAQFLGILCSAICAVPAIILLLLGIYYYSMNINAHKLKIEKLKMDIIVAGQDRQYLLSRLSDFA